MDNVVFQNEHFAWYNLENPTEEMLAQYLDKFSLNSFTISDTMEPGHLPKFEHHENFEFVLIRFYGKERRSYTNIIREFSHKIGIFIGENFLITVHQKPMPFLNDILDFIKTEKVQDSFLPKNLFYQIVKRTLQTFQAPSVRISEQIDLHEDQLFLKKNKEVSLAELYKLKRESNTCSKILILTRDVLNEYKSYVKSASSYKDLQEFNAKLIHLHNQNSDDLQNLFHLSLSVSSQRANEIMKLLTIFSAFFLPLTFIVGVYGMNFRFMPELDWHYGYFICLGVMLVVVVVIFLWFKRKKIL